MQTPSLDISVYKEALIVLATAGVVIPLFHRLHISRALGFILVGIVVGPFGLSSLAPDISWLSVLTIRDPRAIESIAHLGIVLLLFMIGLELSFERLWVMRRLVFGLGSLQLVFCGAVLAGAVTMLGYGRIGAPVVGLALAMSSTAVVLQVLSEEKRLNTAVGRTSFAVLLFQDLAVVPALVVLGTPAHVDHAAAAPGLGFAVVRAFIAVGALVAVGRLVLRPLFRRVAGTRSAEVFVAACLLVVIVAGLATAAAGLSMPLGALIGGLLLAGTEYRRQVEVTIEPFKGLSVGVFLIAVGMSVDTRIVIAEPLLVLGTGSSMVLIKLLIVAALAGAFGLNRANSLHIGLLLAPGGEFAFVILSAARGANLLSANDAGIMLFATAMTMASIPLLSGLGARVAPCLGPKTSVNLQLLVPDGFDAQSHVIVAGFGRVGQTVGAMLAVHEIPYVAIDHDPDRVARRRKDGAPVYFGDAMQIELLRRLHLETARALVVTLDDPAAADEIVTHARAARGDLLIVARARDAGHAARLYRAGASDAVPETIEASLQLSEAVLTDIGVPIGPVIASIHEKRAAVQAEIRAVAPEAKIRKLGGRRLRDRL